MELDGNKNTHLEYVPEYYDFNLFFEPETVMEQIKQLKWFGQTQQECHFLLY